MELYYYYYIWIGEKPSPDRFPLQWQIVEEGYPPAYQSAILKLQFSLLSFGYLVLGDIIQYGWSRFEMSATFYSLLWHALFVIE